MEFDPVKTAVAFLVLVGIGTGALIAAPMMATRTVLMMVLPSMLVFGGLCLAIGVKHGEYRATSA
jgi:ribulose 1,5-bisphosphate synthetase/thiazole synthase